MGLQKFYRKPTNEYLSIEKDIIEIFNLPMEVYLIKEYNKIYKDENNNIKSQAYCHIEYTNEQDIKCSLEIQKSVFVLIYIPKENE